MDFKVSYGRASWDCVELDSNCAGFDELEDMDDRPIALASFIVRRCLEEAEDRVPFTMDDVIVVEIHGEKTNGDTLDVPLPDGHGTFDVLIEQCETLVKLHDLVEGCHDVDRLMATIEHEGWDNFDFDNSRYWDDHAFGQFDEGDYEAFAKEEMEVCEIGIHIDLQSYFDYDQYGRDLIADSYYMEVFNGTMYVFNRH